jgi:hypothetical protein
MLVLFECHGDIRTLSDLGIIHLAGIFYFGIFFRDLICYVFLDVKDRVTYVMESVNVNIMRMRKKCLEFRKRTITSVIYV